MATDIQSMINKVTGGTSLGQSPATPVLSPVQNLATYNPKTTAPSTPLPVNTTIPGSQLNQNTVTVNPPIVSTTANTKLGAAVASGVATQPPAPVVTAPAPKDDSIMTRLTEIAGLQKGKPADVEQIRKDEGVFDKQAQAQNIKNEYDAKDRYYEKKKREIEKNAQGMLSGGLQAQLDNLDRERNQELADIAIRYNAANGDYKVAFDIAQAKIDAKYEPLKDEIDTLKSQFMMRQDDLTASEKLAAQEAINRREAEYNFQKDKEMLDYKTRLEQSDPLYQAQLKKAQNDANGIVGGEQLYSGLTSSTATAVRGKVSKFSSEPLVQSFATVQEGNNYAQTIDDNSKNPAEHQALIYALAKALDPGSVVREGEYATAQKYAQSWVSAYGKGVTQALAGTGFLSSSAISNIKSVINQKYEASKKSYESLEKSYTQNINDLTGRGDGDKFLSDYATPVVDAKSAKEELDMILKTPTPADLPETADRGWFKSFLNVFGL